MLYNEKTSSAISNVPKRKKRWNTKARVCADGGPLRLYTEKEDTVSPTRGDDVNMHNRCQGEMVCSSSV